MLPGSNPKPHPNIFQDENLEITVIFHQYTSKYFTSASNTNQIKYSALPVARWPRDGMVGPVGVTRRGPWCNEDVAL